MECGIPNIVSPCWESLTTAHFVMYNWISIQIHTEIQQLNAFTFLQKSLKNLQAFHCLLGQNNNKRTRKWLWIKIISLFHKKWCYMLIITIFFDKISGKFSTLHCKQYKVHQRSKETQSKKPNMDSKEKPKLHLVCSFSSSRLDYHVSPPYHMLLMVLLILLTQFGLAFR